MPLKIKSSIRKYIFNLSLSIAEKLFDFEKILVNLLLSWLSAKKPSHTFDYAFKRADAL